MNNIHFSKYQGTGNDFVIIDGRGHRYETQWTKEEIARICHRRYGVGADGLMILQDTDVADFEMIYYNSDGGRSTMCGNGGRCIVAFASSLGIFSDKTSFLAIDGIHEAAIKGDLVYLKMNNVNEWGRDNEAYVMNTGSPHYVSFVDDMSLIDVNKEGADIRYSPRYSQEGINVNFVKEYSDHIEVATYERGVEAQTYSCGTGVVASSISHALRNNQSSINCRLITMGGELRVTADRQGEDFNNVWLIGPAVLVFEAVYKS